MKVSERMSLTNINIVAVARYFVSFSMFMFLMLSVSFSGSYAISGTLIILSYLFFFSKEVRQQISLSKTEKWLIIVFLGYLLSVLCEILYYSIPVSVMDSEGKILLFIPLILLLNAVKINPKVIVFGLGFGALGVFTLAFYEHFILGVVRVGSFINAIQLGNIALTFGLLSLLMSGYKLKNCKYPKTIRILLLLSGIGGVIAALLTLTRGGLVFLPVILIISSFYFITEVKQFKKQLLIGLVITCGTLFLLSDGVFTKRIQTSLNNIESYFVDGKATTSTGIRLELWKAAILIAKENQVLGVGNIQYLKDKDTLINQGDLQSSIRKYDSSHNAYFYAYVRRGFVGLFFLTALLVYPVYIAHRELRKTKNNKDRSRIPAISLLVFGLFFIFANLTQALFHHNSGMIMYNGLLILLIYLNVQASQSNAKPTDEPIN